MKQFWKKGIVGIIMLAIFLAPVSAGIKVNDKGNLAIKIKTNSAKTFKDFLTYENILKDSYVKFHSASSSSAEFEVKIIGVEKDWEKAEYILTDILGAGIISVNKNSTVLVVMENGEYVSHYDLSGEVRNGTKSSGITLINKSYIGPEEIEGRFPVKNLKSEKNYTVALYYKSIPDGDGGGINLFGSTDKDYYQFGSSDSFSTPKEGGLLAGEDPTESRPDTIIKKRGGIDLDCNLIGTGRANTTYLDGVIGCVAGIFYMVWEVSAIIARYAGQFLDFFVYYSTDSGSYGNEFVSKAWGAVRDIANIFFIIALLYVAIKTILGLNVTDNKKLVGTVIIIALIINFSLFTTKVVIDASNILAKVFYNNITSEDATTKDDATGASGQKSISVGLINKYDPQNLMNNDEKKYDESRGMFIFYTILLVAITLYTAYIFFSIALLFVARVVSLWLAMIFSPIAFASYTVPFEIPGFGHKEWWKNLLDNAMLAPIFIFILYIIVLFAGFLKTITDKSDSVMTVMVPFIILVVLLQQAKKLAIKYSGEMGAAIMSAGKMVGGLALGAATGGAALLGSKTIGAKALSVANNDELRRKAAAGDRGAQRKLAIANTLAKSSFDFRQTGAGKGFGKISGMDMSKGLGIKATSTEQLKGGAKAKFERKVEKEEEKMKSYEMTTSAALKQDERARDKNDPQNIRAAQYEKDLEEAKKKPNEEWQKKYKSALFANNMSQNPIDEKTFEENYKKNNPPIISSFNEIEFKKKYQNGEDLSDYGLNKKVESGSVKKVQTSKEVNDERRTAYAYSLAHPSDGDMRATDRTAIKSFLMEWKRGMTGMLGTKGGLATTATATALGGPIGAAVALSLGGLVKAIMTTRPANKELVARIAKGKNDLQKMKEIFEKVAKGDKKAEQELKKLSEDVKKEKENEKESH